ncbi:PREDICTED: podocalyxin [Chinchilla lanigera]|uniref:podocalyxin n=1 Tax=Chinchilla lanigera TaxID=34839 RepID=UPI00038F0D01|nr:PREDICTED: podocalyxin [Chinchilla lanigera]
MRAPLALSALLLVLRSPLPSLSQDPITARPGSTIASTQASAKSVTSASTSQSDSSSVPTTSKAPSISLTNNVATSSAGPKDSAQQSTSGTLSTNARAPTTVSPQAGSAAHPTTTTATTAATTATTTATTATSPRPESTSNKNDNAATTQSVSSSESQVKASGSQSLPLETTASPSAPSLPSAGSSTTHRVSRLPTGPTAMPSGTSPQGQDGPAIPSGSSGSAPDSSLTHTTQRTLTTQTPTNVPAGTQQTTSMRPGSQVPDRPVPGSLMPPSPSNASAATPQPTDSAAEPVTTPGAQGSTSLSTVLASSSPSIPDKSWSFGNKTVRCESLKEPIGELLVLNLTSKGTSSEAHLGSNHCNTGLLNEKLVTVLCRAVKDNFNPGQDNCTVKLGPVPNSHAVAVKHISIHTNLLPTDVYKSLKDQWDELQELGVSDMRLGNNGPPEPTEDRYSMPLIITIVCMASFLLLVAALYGCCHQRFSQRKDQTSHLDSSTQIPGSQPWLHTSRSCKNISMPSFLARQREPDLWISQRLTEELQTVENGYHDNPTLEVMETSSEMQEKKVVSLNGELGDSWIVPLDNLCKDDLDEEEDTHL